MELKLIATQPPHSSLTPKHRGPETLLFLDTAFLIIMAIAILSLILAPLYAYIPQWRKHSASFRENNKAPCDRCQYFSRNAYLNCALHPLTVLTERSVDCVDYCSNSQTN